MAIAQCYLHTIRKKKYRRSFFFVCCVTTFVNITSVKLKLVQLVNSDFEFFWTMENAETETDAKLNLKTFI